MPRKKKEAAPKKIKYYDIKTIWKKGADYTICIGQRGNGKSWSSLKICLENWRDKKHRFCYLRRWTEDVNTFACNTLFKQELIDEVFGPDYEITYRNHVFTLKHTEVDEDTGKDVITKEDIGYATSVSDAKHRKGTNFPDTDIIFFDEFIDMAGENILANEYNKFENIVSTIKRTNKVRIIMCANTVQKYSEYFTKLGINPDRVEQGEIKEYLHPNGKTKIIYQWCPYNKEIGDLAGELTNSKMISEGSWEITEVSEIPSETDEIVEEKLLFTAYEPNIDATIGVYVHYGTWKSYKIENHLTIPEEHEREFLVIRRVQNGVKSSYYHLTNQKSLANNYYSQMDLLLKDILDETEIDVRRELLHLRVYCDHMFTGDIFNQIWQYYNIVKIRTLL